MLAIINAKIVMKDHYVPNGVILTSGEHILFCGKQKDVQIPKDAKIIDAKGQYVGPGLIEIHTHAADNKWIFEYPKETSEYMLSHGMTSVLPALYYNLNKEKYVEAAKAIIDSYEKGEFKNFLGVYM